MVRIAAASPAAGWTIVEAPSGLGLRPPAPGREPGTAGAPAALRAAGLHERLTAAGARDDGAPVLPAPYDPVAAPGHLRNQAAILDHSRRLADRIDAELEAGRCPLILGGDCGILLGAGIALARRARRSETRIGLLHLDGHTDFRHPGNSDECASLAGEDLAAAIGRHWPAVADIDGLGPYFAPESTAHAGCRDDDEELAEVRAAIGAVLPVSQLRERGSRASALHLREVAAADGGHWLHVDVDILDPGVLSAVDSPDPGGLEVDELRELLGLLLPGALGLQITVFDPDLDRDGSQARRLADLLVDVLGGAPVAERD